MSTDTLRMPEHNVVELGRSLPCRGGRVAGYAHVNSNGTLHCNRCGWVTPEPVVTAYSEDTGSVYLNWDELVAEEASGYVVVGTSERPGTVPVVVGLWPPSEAGKREARKAQARLRRKWAKEEAQNGSKIHTHVRVLWKVS